MSIRVMNLVSERFPGGGSDLICMLFLADWCADDGSSLYPSIALLAAKMRVSESQARRVLHGLIDCGYVAVVGNLFGGAPGTTRQYRLDVTKLSKLPVLATIVQHLERSAAYRWRLSADESSLLPIGETACMDDTPSADATPSMDARDGSQGCAGGVAPMRETGRIGDTLTTMNHQLTIKEPLKTRKAKSPKGDDVRKAFVGVDELVAEGVDRQHAIDWLAVRTRKGSQLTLTAWTATKREAAKAGMTAAQAVQTVAESGWLGFKAEYVAKNARAAPVQTPTRNMSSRDASRAAAANSIGLGTLKYDNEPFTIDADFQRID
ncbi:MULTISPECIES: helix-turn-helix domain-containing protein [Paraburkholderia]|uniref:Helix-turn-helix domain-containing protein n=1 Tax=Paraburkholderia podalyriae TaxID=1938811 RepID=A0ABR7PQJ2_9BURK|nr:helix-turn-helix domain-containing protein [Paraburkholderia podalyriae]MBC8748531.1 hypothetical protein [Paraburkholderia podalyriae]